MGRLKFGKTMLDIICDFSEGNPGCAEFIMESLNKTPQFMMKVLMFADNNEIYGSKLYMLWNDCCDRDLDKVDKTIDYLLTNKVSQATIHENLNRGRALPFI